jgi:hypothetical protein
MGAVSRCTRSHEQLFHTIGPGETIFLVESLIRGSNSVPDENFAASAGTLMQYLRTWVPGFTVTNLYDNRFPQRTSFLIKTIVGE